MASKNSINQQGSANCQCSNGFFRIKGECVKCGANRTYNNSTGICECNKQFYEVETKCIKCLNL